MGLGVSDQLGNAVHRKRRIDLHDIRHADNSGDRRDVLDEIETELVIERRVDCARRRDHKERVTVGRSLHDRLGTDIATGAGAVLDDELFPEPLRQPLTHEAREDVGRAACGEAHDQTHRPARIGLRPCNPRQRGETGSSQP